MLRSSSSWTSAASATGLSSPRGPQAGCRLVTRPSSPCTPTSARARSRLYGFASSEERTAFELLLGAHGVGPGLALAILSIHEPGRARPGNRHGQRRRLEVGARSRAEDRGPAAVGAAGALRLLERRRGDGQRCRAPEPAAVGDLRGRRGAGPARLRARRGEGQRCAPCPTRGAWRSCSASPCAASRRGR